MNTNEAGSEVLATIESCSPGSTSQTSPLSLRTESRSPESQTTESLRTGSPTPELLRAGYQSAESSRAGFQSQLVEENVQARKCQCGVGTHESLPATSFTLQNTDGRVLSGLTREARAIVEAVPRPRKEKSVWMKTIARNEEITLHVARLFGITADGLEVPFTCVLHPNCMAKLTRGKNGEIVYYDPLAKRPFKTLPEVAAELRTGAPKKLSKTQHALWRVRLLHEAKLIVLPEVAAPDVTPNSPDPIKAGQRGFELLARCSWFLDPARPALMFARAFVQSWCGLADDEQTRWVIADLIRQGVMHKVAEEPSGRSRPTYLYRPGPAPSEVNPWN